MYVYVCKDSIEGILTAVYNIYEDGHNLPDTRLLTEWEAILFGEYVEVHEDASKVGKVLRTILERFGEEDVHHIFLTLAAEDSGKAEAVYRTIAYGIKYRLKPGHLFDHMADPHVLQAYKLGRGASREAQHLKGFLRFRELEGGILFAVIAPKNDLLAELMEHFSDRFPSEDFLVLDEGRRRFGVHRKGQQWFLAEDEAAVEQIRQRVFTREEDLYAGLFTHFCRTVAISQRRNTALQRNMLPLRFRPYMTEFSVSD